MKSTEELVQEVGRMGLNELKMFEQNVISVKHDLEQERFTALMKAIEARSEEIHTDDEIDVFAVSSETDGGDYQ